MELALITAQQVAVLFLLIGTGMVAVKTGVLKLENKQALSNLLVYIIVPAMVVNSYRMEFSAQILRNLLAAFGMSVLSVLLGTVITLLLTARKTGSRMPIFRFACIFSNAAYMGFPLISALFGSEGLLYASAYVTVFNILLWTLGYGLVSGGSSVKEVARSLVHTPVLYAIVVGLGIYLLQIPLPALITQPLELLAGVNTPLSMLITGMLIAAGDVRSIVTDKHIWKLASVRMLLIPAATLALFGVLGFHGTAAQVVTLLECCPAAAITTVFAVQVGHDEHFAAGSVVLTTLLSIITLPLCALIITMEMYDAVRRCHIYIVRRAAVHRVVQRLFAFASGEHFRPLPHKIKKPSLLHFCINDGFVLERPTRLELATSTLARWRSTR